jgi:hypothetical protein
MQIAQGKLQRETRGGRRFDGSLRGRLRCLFAICLLPFSLLPGGAARAQETLPQPAKTPNRYVTPPDPQRVFRLESEGMLMERMAREAPQGLNPLGLRYEFVLPSYPPAPPPGIVARIWEPQAELIEPAYLCYDRLYFEQINGERYGWSLGPLHPLIAAGVFYFDLATLPYHAATDPLRRYECNPGYALPGDPMPLLLYWPELSVTGALAEAAAVGLMLAIFP